MPGSDSEEEEEEAAQGKETAEVIEKEKKQEAEQRASLEADDKEDQEDATLAKRYLEGIPSSLAAASSAARGPAPASFHTAGGAVGTPDQVRTFLFCLCIPLTFHYTSAPIFRYYSWDKSLLSLSFNANAIDH